VDSLLRTTLIKVLTPALAIALVLFLTHRRRMSWREDLGLRAPTGKVLVGWLVLWIAWVALSEVLIRELDLDQAKPWPDYPAGIVVLRILAIGFLGPGAEELVMRGLFLGRLQRTRVGPLGAILIVAVVWAAFHYSYGPGTLVLVTTDGVLFGLARVRGGSLWIPIAMHVLGNLFSLAQSLTA